MIQFVDIRQPSNAKQVVALQKESYQVEADLIGVETLPPLRDTIETIQTSSETFIGFFDGFVLAGILSFKISDKSVDIHRVAVSPSYFRRGIARALLAFLEDYASNVEGFVVHTGALNKPAVELYINAGFVPNGRVEVEPGLWIQKFHKQKRR